MDATWKQDQSSNLQPSHEAIRLPLLENAPSSLIAKPPKTPARKAVRKAFKGTADLVKLLPSGTVFIFHLFSPVLTDEGKCQSDASKALSLGLVASCAASCFFLSFTDSFRDGRGKVRYGLATFWGLMVIDGSGITLSPEEARKYRIRVVDFFHACMSIIIFAAVATSDENLIHCFFPTPSIMTVEFVRVVPVAVGTICSTLFVVLPSKRHGIGFPLSRH